MVKIRIILNYSVIFGECRIRVRGVGEEEEEGRKLLRTSVKIERKERFKKEKSGMALKDAFSQKRENRRSYPSISLLGSHDLLAQQSKRTHLTMLRCFGHRYNALEQSMWLCANAYLSYHDP